MNKKTNKKAKNLQINDYWLNGYHACVAAINNADRQKNLLIMTKEVSEKLSKNFDIQKFDFEHRIVSRHEIDKYVGREINHQGIGLNVRRIEKVNIKDFVKNLPQDISTIAILDQLEDSQNVGAIFRSALAFNINGIIMTESNSVGENSFVAKTASGALDIVPFTVINNISNIIKFLKECGYWIYGLDGKSSMVLEKTKFPNKIALVLGSESKGMRNITSTLCDELIRININPEIESLNVSNTAAIAFYHLSTSK